ncbi:MAG: alkane 1-monooxygenase [Gammaproteobacteria bacterium]
MKYLRYFGTHLLILGTTIGFVAGESWYWLGLVLGFVFWVGGDALSAEVRTTPNYNHPRILEIALYSLSPPLTVMTIMFAWILSPGDLFSIGESIKQWSGYDPLGAKSAGELKDYLGACLSFGLAMAMGGILTAHELGHRTDDRIAMWVARWMLAMAFNASLEVAHVFGHHRDVGTPLDPATARRGENIYHFFVRSTFGQFFQAWRIEKERLQSATQLTFFYRNKVTRGLVRSMLIAGLFCLAGGWFALGAFLLASMWNKFLLESLNYAEHYGLVRVPNSPVEPRHAWDSFSSFSHAALFNLPWHADHHSRVGVHYPDLVNSRSAPVLPQGYLASLPLIWIPPLWRRLITPHLRSWDDNKASAEEIALLKISHNS